MGRVSGALDTLRFVDVAEGAVGDVGQVGGGCRVVVGDGDLPLRVGGKGPFDEQMGGEDQDVPGAAPCGEASVDVGLDGAQPLGVGRGRQGGVGEVVGEPVGVQVRQRADTQR